MNVPKVGAVIAGTVMMTTSIVPIAAEDIGQREYDNNCAVCHGASGTGNGPYAGIIGTKIPDLTMLQKQNGGVFPFDKIFETIDGRAMVAAHGTRDMPIWGNEYNDKVAEYYSDYFREFNAAGFVRGRILALVNHIYGLQEK